MYIDPRHPQRPKLLAVSYGFPPLPSPRSIQVSRLLKSLDASVSVVSADETGAKTDVTIEPDVESRLERCLRIPFSPKRSNTLAAKLLSQLSRPVRSFRNATPDQYKSWLQPTAAAIADLIEVGGYRPDALVTFAQPFTDHLIGKELKQNFGIPWIAHFSDPWVDNPFIDLNILTRGANRELENQVVRNADLVVFTSNETRDLVMKKYGEDDKNKARVLPHCFDPDRYRTTSDANPRNEIVIRHLGDFYGPRSPLPLIRALIAISESKPGVLDCVRFELVGLVDDSLVAKAINGRLPANLITVRRAVPYQESLDLMSTADGLLVVDAASDLSVFLPSKLIDYIGSGRPVFGVTPAGAARNLIRELGGPVADPREIDEVVDQLAKFIQLLRDRRRGSQSDIWGNEDVRSGYEAGHVAAKFMEMLNETIAW